MSSGKKEIKKVVQKTKPEASVERKSDGKTTLEKVLETSAMKTLQTYKDEEVMALYERVKHLHDVVKTRMLLLPRDLRVPTEQAKYMKEILSMLEKENGGVVEDGEEDEEDEEDVDQIEPESDESDDDEDENIAPYMALFKSRLVLVDLIESDRTVDDDEGMMMEDDMDIDEGDSDDDEAAMDEDIPKKKKGPTVTELASDDEEDEEDDEDVLLAEMIGKKGKRAVVGSDDEEDDEEDEEDEEEDDYDGVAMARNFSAVFSLLNAEGEVVATNIVLESSDIYEGEFNYQGQHHLHWEEQTIFSLNAVDGELVEPEVPSLEELQAEFDDAEELDEEMLASELPNDFDDEIATALRETAEFPEELAPIQFVVLMTRVMARLVKNAARNRGPAPADGDLPLLVVTLSNEVAEANAEAAAEEESSEEEKVVVPAKKEKKQVAAPVADKKHSADKKASAPAPAKDAKKHDKKPQHQEKPHQHEKKPQHQEHHKKPSSGSPAAKPHHHNDKKSPSKPHQHEKQHNNNNGNKQHNSPHHDKKHQHNDKKRSHPTGDREDRNGKQKSFKKH